MKTNSFLGQWHTTRDILLHNILQGRASQPFSTIKKSIQQHPRFMLHWILVHFKLKFCWKKLFALIVTSILQWINFEITIEATIETTVNLL
jgi:hypothetical protein